MLKALLSTLVLFVGISASANNSLFTELVSPVMQAAQEEAQTLGLNWTVGDTNNYSLNMGFIKGSMNMTVREKNSEGFWLDQNVDLGFLGKQKIEVLIDPNTGAVKKMIVNGKEQAPPEAGDMEVIEVKESSVKVPAGSFQAVYMRILNKKENQESENWLNPKEIPISGMLKSISPSQMGKVTIELVSFKKN